MKSTHERKVRIFRLLNELGVPTSIVGREYIETGILLMMQDKVMLYEISKKLYPAVAQQHGISVHAAVSGIRHAIELAWERGSTDEINRLFGYTISYLKNKPTNSEFLTMIARWLLLEEEEDNNE